MMGDNESGVDKENEALIQIVFVPLCLLSTIECSISTGIFYSIGIVFASLSAGAGYSKGTIECAPRCFIP